MDTCAEAEAPSVSLAGRARRLVNRLMAVGENRFQLMLVEVQQERNRMVDMVFMACAVMALGLLCGIAWSAALVFLFWPLGPGITLLVLGAVYGAAAAVICRRLTQLRRNHVPLAATLDQLQKDRACLEKS